MTFIPPSPLLIRATSLIPKSHSLRNLPRHYQSHLFHRPRQQHQQRRTLSTITKTRNKNDGYQTIGSFHSENVEELMRLPKEQYIPPPLPFDTSSEGQSSLPLTSSSPSSPSSTALPFANSHTYHTSYPNLHRHQWTFLNHGAFGLALECGLRRATSWRTFLETQPLRYFDRYLLPHLVHGARGLADFVTTNEVDARVLYEGVALIPNVTMGMNAVVGGHERWYGDGLVFYYDITYGSTKKMCQTYHGNEKVVEIPFEQDYLPLLQNKTSSSEIFIAALDDAIHTITQKRSGNNNNTSSSSSSSSSSLAGSLLILDHITSNTAIQLPIRDIAKHAKEKYGLIVVVDGAHALLSLPLDMGSLLSTTSGEEDGVESRSSGSSSPQQQHEGENNNDNNKYVDIYLTNCHKWFSAPRGAAVMFCNSPRIRDTILARPAVISHGVDDGFASRFMWDGCRDYSAQLSLPVVLDYWTTNLEMVRAEMERNLKEGVRILISHWHPGVVSCGDDDKGDDDEVMMLLADNVVGEAGFTLVPLEMHAPQMALVRLPNHLSGGEEEKGGRSSTLSEQRTSTDAKRLQDFLYGHNVEVPIKCVRGVLYARVSCHVYNSAEEFERLARVALTYISP